MEQKKWVYKYSALSREKILDFAKECDIPAVMAVVYLNRGIDSKDALEKYLKKSLESVYNPMLLHDMQESCQRIKSAIDEGEKITIYGDYDADGVTSTSILYMFLKEQGADVSYYIPDRFREGYGLNIMAVNRISKTGTKLLITVDCGIVSTGEVQLAKAQGMDVIITDHHTPGEKLPETLVIHPKLGEDYPFGELAGVGVAFKLILGLGMTLGLKSGEVFAKYADIAAIGTIADVVDLKDENRVIADRGIKLLRHTKNYGIAALMEVAGVKPETLNSTSVAFGISPRINAAGRMASAADAVELILSQSREDAYKKALILDENNRSRRSIESKIFDEALSMIEKDVNFGAKKVIVLAGEGWHHGVIGIVAARILEKFYKPCILISSENGLGKGSARSIPGFNMFDALSDSSELLTKFGGHSQAAGLSLSMSQFDEFEKRINKYAEKVLTDEDMIKKIEIDCKIRLSDVSPQTVRMIDGLEPFGMGNEKPIFAVTGAKVAAIAKMGADGKHLRIRISDGRRLINCVGFSMGELADEIGEGDSVDIAFSMEINEFNGTKNLQLMLKDVRKSEV